jgi:hypothetical protein
MRLALGGNDFELLSEDFGASELGIPPESDAIDLRTLRAERSPQFDHAASHPTGGEDLHPVAHT